MFEIDSQTLSDLKNIINDKSNTIIFTNADDNRFEIISCICELIDSNTKIDFFNTTEDIKYSSAQKIIIPSPNMSEIIKILEHIITDSKNYIFSFPIKSFDNILDSLKVLISMQLPNLTNQELNHILVLTAPNLIYTEKNENGHYKIKSIYRISAEGQKPILTELSNKLKNSEIIIDEEQVIPKSEELKEEILEINTQSAEEIYKEESDKLSEENEPVVEEETTKKKINKYKLLKEKIRNKKLQ